MVGRYDNPVPTVSNTHRLFQYSSTDIDLEGSFFLIVDKPLPWSLSTVRNTFSLLLEKDFDTEMLL